MSDKNMTVTMRVPMTVKIGPVPSDLTSHSQLFTFALANIKKILADKGIDAQFDGERALASYVNGDGLATFTSLGAKLDDRHYRLQPSGADHALEISLDRGETFVSIATFSDFDFAKAIGEAWVDGRAEKAA